MPDGRLDAAVGWPATRDVFGIRREVVLLASLVGAALAAAGVTYQAILRNPLADPYLLGVSSGAALFAYLWRLPALAGARGGRAAARRRSRRSPSPARSSRSSGCSLLASRRGRLEPVTLLLVGVIVNALNGSIFLLVYNLVVDDAVVRRAR